MQNDFGYAALNILYLLPSDEGTWTLVIANEAGQAESSIDIRCSAGDSLLTDTFHQSAIGRIAELEAPRPAPADAPDAEKVPPQITQQLQTFDAKFAETQAVRVDARYLPVDDNELRVEWFLNGAPLHNSNRHAFTNSFGNASLTINWLLLDDTGEYVSRFSSPFSENLLLAYDRKQFERPRRNVDDHRNRRLRSCSRLDKSSGEASRLLTNHDRQTKK